MNITKSAAAGRVLGVARPVTEKLVVDMCFVLEGQAADELPEMVIGCSRLSHLNLGDASIPMLSLCSDHNLHNHVNRMLPCPLSRPSRFRA